MCIQRLFSHYLYHWISKVIIIDFFTVYLLLLNRSLPGADATSERLIKAAKRREEDLIKVVSWQVFKICTGLYKFSVI